MNPDDLDDEALAAVAQWSEAMGPTVKPKAATRPTIGSSDVASILGLSPYKTPGETWAALMGLTERYTAPNETDQAFGHLVEKALLIAWEETHGQKLQRTGALTETPLIRDWAHTHPDGLGTDCVVEAKTCRTFHEAEIILVRNAHGEHEREFPAWGESGTSQVPMGYRVQAVWHMYVTGRPVVYLEALAALSYEPRHYIIPRDLGLEALIVGKVQAWLEAYVWPGDITKYPKPPEYAVVSKVFARGFDAESAGTLDPTETDLELCAEYARLNAQAKAAEVGKKAIAATMIERIGSDYNIRDLCRSEFHKARREASVSDIEKRAPEIYQQLDALGLIKHGRPSRVFKLAKEKE